MICISTLKAYQFYEEQMDEELEIMEARDEASSYMRKVYLDNLKDTYKEDWERAYMIGKSKHKAEQLLLEWTFEYDQE